MRRAGGIDSVNSDFNRPVGAVLKANRAGKARREFTVNLRFGGARANSSPAHQVSHILWRDHIEELTGGRQAGIIDVQQQLAGNAQAIIDLVAVVHMRIVNQPFPAHGGSRLFKIHAHHHF